MGQFWRALKLLTRLNARLVDDYIETRQEEGASNNTISKELTTLRGALKVAKRRDEFAGDIEAILPNGFSAEYKPKERFLTSKETQALLRELNPDRAARVAFVLATSARLGESDRARVEDVDLRTGLIKIRGTKTDTSARIVPIVGVGQQLIEHALRYAQGEDGLLFRPWGSVRRDLHNACAKANIGNVSPNDLRRTTATWLVMSGVPLHLVVKVLGHKDTRMVERVYGPLPPEALREAPTMELNRRSEDQACITYAPNVGTLGVSEGHQGESKAASPNAQSPETEALQGFTAYSSTTPQTTTPGFSIPVSIILQRSNHGSHYPSLGAPSHRMTGPETRRFGAL